MKRLSECFFSSDSITSHYYGGFIALIDENVNKCIHLCKKDSVI